MIRIIIDSSADYLKEEIEKKQMTLVSLTINLDERLYLDGVDISRDQLYEWLMESQGFPKTSQPSPEVFLKHFKEAKEAGDDVICILLSSSLSGTCQSAHLAKTMADYDNIYIVDSLSATHLIRFLGNKACQMRDAGASAKEIVETLEELKTRTKVIAAVDTLEYLCRGGRVSKAAATIGNLANLKPIITVNPEGEVAVIAKCVGKNKSLSYILNALQEYEIDENYPLYSIYSYGVENCIALEAKVVNAGYLLHSRKQIGATIGCHVGPGAFGVLFVHK
ncbi:MAG: DegV family protein [Lachnospiraceae bacterium]|nr:DegV family protein [Lachnospiraceae bacterium]